MNKEAIARIRELYKKYLLKRASDFCIDDYNSFQEGIWRLKDELNLNNSPFLLLPDPAKDADYYMMNVSGDGLVEPNIENKEKYLAMMKESYNKLS